jgi:CAAX protease family protein
MTTTTRPGRPRGRLSYPKLCGLILAFLLVPQLVSLFVVAADGFSSSYGSVRSAFRYEIVPDLGGALLAIVVIIRLRWVEVVLHERLRTRRWVLVVPIALGATSIALIDYGRLAQASAGLVAALVVGTLATALSEELMFRGIVLQAMRDRHREVVAAWLTALLFGGFHLVNVLVVGAGAIPQALWAVASGYLLYLSRRASGGIVVPIVVHWLWDLAVYSVLIGTDEDVVSDQAFYLFLADLGLLVVLAVGRRAISPAATS